MGLKRQCKLDPLAVSHIESQLKLSPEDGTLWLQKANLLSDAGKYTGAIRCYHKAQKLLPGRDLRLYLGSSLICAKQLDAGIYLIKKFIIDHNDYSFPYVVLITSLLNADAIDKANSWADRGLRKYPGDAQLLHAKGRCMWHKFPGGNRDLEWYRKAIDGDPSLQVAWSSLGAGLIKNEHTILEGVEALKRALEMDPEDYWATVYLAHAYWIIGSHEEADRLFRRAIEISPWVKQTQSWYRTFLRKTHPKSDRE